MFICIIPILPWTIHLFFQKKRYETVEETMAESNPGYVSCKYDYDYGQTKPAITQDLGYIMSENAVLSKANEYYLYCFDFVFWNLIVFLEFKSILCFNFCLILILFHFTQIRPSPHPQHPYETRWSTLPIPTISGNAQAEHGSWKTKKGGFLNILFFSTLWIVFTIY